MKIPNEFQWLLMLLRQAYESSLPSIPVCMEDSIPNLNPDPLPVTCMIWNVQGAGSKNFISTLRELIKVNKSDVLALVETHMGGDQAVKIASIIGYDGHVRVDAVGFSGGIWVYWKQALVTVNPISQHQQHITMEITRVGEIPWYFSAIYASPDPSKRQELWKELRDFAASRNKPWLMAGDFNDTRYPSERNKSCSETNRRSRMFNDWVEEMDLLEVEFVGAAHTWARGKSMETRQSARLDRALCNGDWAMRFDKASMRHLSAVHSDHCPLFISPNGFVPMQSLHRPFRFQATWLTHENFKDFVAEKWDKHGNLINSLAKLSTDLQHWNRDVFGNIFKQKRHLLARIAGVQKKMAVQVDRGLIKLEAKLRRDLDEILEREEVLWYQKARIEWLKNGDRNTTFFQLSTVVKRWKNKTVSLKREDGVWLHDKNEIKDHIVNYYSKLFTEEGEPSHYDLPQDISWNFPMKTGDL
ncbi:uncharacterized protein LOC110691155 [Chenopodium quinoa]|uniref:uncharacterized protein LOC110691155 n=1 Tax=Chenopodium quinoa TaxID=63459 RepID=UPI000B78601F|nr:uncharacterized protein LOC110691155 [Chenopodium quinoa]